MASLINGAKFVGPLSLTSFKTSLYLSKTSLNPRQNPVGLNKSFVLFIL